jgi:hypothetical protein
VARHRAWITRGYAIGLGAATQFVLHLVLWLLFGAKPQGVGKALVMGAGWALNLVVAELSVRARPRTLHQPTL